MENIKKGPKPEVLITAGLHDPRVAYWEAAKYAARLRAANETRDLRILLQDGPGGWALQCVRQVPAVQGARVRACLRFRLARAVQREMGWAK